MLKIYKHDSICNQNSYLLFKDINKYTQQVRIIHVLGSGSYCFYPSLLETADMGPGMDLLGTSSAASPLFDRAIVMSPGTFCIQSEQAAELAEDTDAPGPRKTVCSLCFC